MICTTTPAKDEKTLELLVDPRGPPRVQFERQRPPQVFQQDGAYLLVYPATT